ncbi:MAG: sugar ABC transporter permease [Caldilineaceae bacterium]|nr:sugar ABC transporter permease [Caldilineaceae bacterium]
MIPPSSPMRRREERDGWLFASPWLLGFLLFTVGPMIASAFFAFTEYDVLTQPKWVGWANFDKALTDDPKVGQALKVTSIYAGVSVPLQILLGLCVALLLNTQIRGLQFYRTVYYLPSVLSGVAVALLWRWIYAPNFGLINSFLARFDIVGPGWLGDKDWALTSMIGMSLWHVGGGIVIYLAGLQGVPSELYEAVRVDGAGRGAAFWHITLPMITPVLFYNLVIGIITALQIFTQALIMTNGGPHEATLFIVLYLYRNAFQFFKMGYASVLAWILFAYILVLTLLVYRSSGFWVFYAGELKSR